MVRGLRYTPPNSSLGPPTRPRSQSRQPAQPMACTDPAPASVLRLKRGLLSPYPRPRPASPRRSPLPWSRSRPSLSLPVRLEYPRARSSAGEFRGTRSGCELPSRGPFAVPRFVFRPQLPLLLQDLRGWDRKAASWGVSTHLGPCSWRERHGYCSLGVPGAAHEGARNQGSG